MTKKSIPASKKIEVPTTRYKKFIASLKIKIRSAQIKGAIAVNKELIKLYWDIGKDIVEKQAQEEWGSKVLEKIAKDLQNEFPGIEGFSRTNLFRMKAFYTAYAKIPQVVGQIEQLPIFSIPWGHNIILLESLKQTEERLWYASKTMVHGWSRNILTIWIDNERY